MIKTFEVDDDGLAVVRLKDVADFVFDDEFDYEFWQNKARNFWRDFYAQHYD